MRILFSVVLVAGLLLGAEANAQEAVTCLTASADREGTPGNQTPHQRRLQEARETCEALAADLLLAQQRNALAAARVAALPASTYAGGATEVGTGSGGAEALVLAARQINEAAENIAKAARAKAGEAEIFVYGGTAFPDLSLYRIYSVRQKAVLGQLAAALPSAEVLSGRQIETNNLLPELQIAANVLSYLRTDRSLSGGELTKVENNMLVAAVLGAGQTGFRTFQDNSVSQATLATFEGELKALDIARAKLDAALALCPEVKSDRDAALAAADDDAAREAVTTEYQPKIAACSTVEAAAAAHREFAAHYTGAGDGAANVSDLLEQMNYGAHLDDADFVLLLNVHGSQGGFYTEKNLWSVFGGVPFYITTGTVISWRLVNTGGEVVAGALAPLYDGYTRMGRVDQD